MTILPNEYEVMDQLFFKARTHNAWLDKPVEDVLLRRLYDAVQWGPTSANTCPMRLTFVKSKEAKERLRGTLAPLNVDKTMAAPVTAIVAYDTAFHEKLGKLFPARPEFAAMFGGMPEEKRTPFLILNTSLQAGYLILAARALGLDCGPMGGFDSAKVDEAFFKGKTWKSSLLINIGYGDESKLFPRNPRLDFNEAVTIE